MGDYTNDYVIVGAGLAGASAIEGIRELDKDRRIVMIGAEPHPPYDRPPLSKKLWFGKKKVEDIFVHSREFYDRNGVTLVTGTRIVSLDARAKTVSCGSGKVYPFEKLLLACGGEPVVAPIPGGMLEGVRYYRSLDDYQRTREEAAEGKSAVVVGGGFIGSEMAAALCHNKLLVTMIYPSPHICRRVFPKELGLAVERAFEERGVQILKTRTPVSFERRGSRVRTTTSGGEQIESDLVIVGIGIKPAIDLAAQAGLKTGDGVIVNEFLQTSHPDIYAAGDNALFPCATLGQLRRVEHWDNAVNQGRRAGQNMAGAGEAYTYMPYFFSDLFDLGYEAVGEVDAQLDTLADWRKENESGVIYYIRDGKVRGAMMCNVWRKVEAARELIRARADAAQGLIEMGKLPAGARAA